MRMLIGTLLLAACVPESASMSMTQHRWTDYHDYMVGVIKLSLENQAAPEPVKVAFAECGADFIDKFILPEERRQLDEYARGNQSITVGEARRMDEAIKARSGIGSVTNANIGVLSSTCPNDVPSFSQLKLPPS